MWLKTTKSYPPAIVEAEVWNQGVSRLGFFWRLRGVVRSMPLLAFGGCQQFLASLGLWLRNSDPCLHGHIIFLPVCLSLFFFCLLWGHLSLDLGPTLIQDDLILSSFPSLKLRRPLFQIRSHSEFQTVISSGGIPSTYYGNLSGKGVLHSHWFQQRPRLGSTMLGFTPWLKQPL